MKKKKKAFLSRVISAMTLIFSYLVLLMKKLFKKNLKHFSLYTILSPYPTVLILETAKTVLLKLSRNNFTFGQRLST